MRVAIDRAVVPQRAEVAQGGEGRDRIPSGEAPQMIDPVIQIVLDTGAAYEQRHGVDDDAHSLQYVLYWQFMRAATVARHHHHHASARRVVF